MTIHHQYVEPLNRHDILFAPIRYSTVTEMHVAIKSVWVCAHLFNFIRIHSGLNQNNSYCPLRFIFSIPPSLSLTRSEKNELDV